MSEENNPFPDETYKAFEFTKADMSQTRFNGVNLTDATFWAVMVNAFFTDTNMASSRFDDVNLAAADFNNINLSGSKLENINFSGATFKGINFSGTRFTSMDLSEVEITDANIVGMKIDGVLVTDLLDAFKRDKT